eukprot:CAMPEP_0175146382 /NCGR_PEP_ID=MMETSP0087-20121206/15351_1 /TAXON_ID=136419 /ORGANISM="Unknown Unknown, Strain D1" /LENGTH=260 /DNA_ID=CAMNT_0016431345 /DNA_START=33 /DNA_END=812 /DNA_ORIENTATION=-
MPFCGECGAQQDDGVKFCGACGKPIPQEEELDGAIKDLSLAQVISGSLAKPETASGPVEAAKCAFQDHVIDPGVKIYTDPDGKTFCEDHLALMTKLCCECGEKTMFDCVTVGEKHYHPQCWKCNEPGCSTILSQTDTVCPQDGLYYCALHIAAKAEAVRQAEEAEKAKLAAKAGSIDKNASEKAAAVRARLEAARAKKNAAPVKPELQSSYKYDDLIALLKGPLLPDGFDKANKEKYLDDEEFKEKFGMEKAAFGALPKW